MRSVIIVATILAVGMVGPAQETTAGTAEVEVVAQDYRFDTSDSIPGGWTTFLFRNEGHTEHFFLLNLLPDSISYEQYVSAVPGAFQTVLDSLRAGMDQPAAVDLLVKLVPAWYFTGVRQMGGTGIVSKGRNTRVTMNLPPGRYAMECYIKEKDLFHTTLGMISQLVVTNEKSGGAPPKKAVDVTLRNYAIEFDDTIEPGSNTFAVLFQEHPEAGLGNDVHIIRLTDTTNLDEVVFWLGWMNVGGLQSPAPVEFFGGIQEMPVGQTGYFTVDLPPGHYAMIAESSASKGMISKFTVE